MELILQRINPITLWWTFLAILGLIVSIITQVLLQFNLKRHGGLKNSIPEVLDMINHNIFAESIRLVAYIISVFLIFTYFYGLIGGEVLGWLLVVMLGFFVLNSLNELVTMIGLLRQD